LQYLHAKSKQVSFPYDVETREERILMSRPFCVMVLGIAEIDGCARHSLSICDLIDTYLRAISSEAMLRWDGLVVKKIYLVLLKEVIDRIYISATCFVIIVRNMPRIQLICSFECPRILPG
jgi:hypothetical protein